MSSASYRKCSVRTLCMVLFIHIRSLSNQEQSRSNVGTGRQLWHEYFERNFGPRQAISCADLLEFADFFWSNVVQFTYEQESSSTWPQEAGSQKVPLERTRDPVTRDQGYVPVDRHLWKHNLLIVLHDFRKIEAKQKHVVVSLLTRLIFISDF